MDIIITLFAMSTATPLFDPPQKPQAVTVEVVKLNTETIDIHSDMWDPKWIEKK